MNLTVTVNSLSLSSDTITRPLTFCSWSLLFFSRRFSMTLWKVDSSLKRTSGVRLRANRRNIVGQQIPTMLDVTRCVSVHTLLRVVGSCRAKFDTGQTFSPVQTDATLLTNNPNSVVTCCVFLHTLLRVVGSCRAKFDTGQTFSPVQTDATLLTNNPNSVVTCCVFLHTLLRVVGSCRAKFDTGQTFSPVQTDATLLANNSQHCSGELLLRFHVRSFKDSLLQSFLSLLVAIIHHLHIYNTPCLPPKPLHNLCF